MIIFDVADFRRHAYAAVTLISPRRRLPKPILMPRQETYTGRDCRVTREKRYTQDAMPPWRPRRHAQPFYFRRHDIFAYTPLPPLIQGFATFSPTLLLITIRASPIRHTHDALMLLSRHYDATLRRCLYTLTRRHAATMPPLLLLRHYYADIIITCD